MQLSAKIEAVLVEYLQSLDPSPYPDYFDPDTQIKPGENDEDIENQYLRCRTSEVADEESPLDTGNFWWSAEVEVRTPSAISTESEESDPDQKEKHQALAAILETAILIDDLADKLNTAASELGIEFTAIAVQARQPGANQDDEVYSSGWTFRLYCCSKTLA